MTRQLNKSFASRAVSTLVAVSLASSFVSFGLVSTAMAEPDASDAPTQSTPATPDNTEKSSDPAPASSRMGTTSTPSSSPVLQDEEAETFTVTWMNGEEKLTETTVKKDAAPVFEGANPTKKATEKVFYVFDGWTLEDSTELITPEQLAEQKVTEDVTYNAHFAEKSVEQVANLVASLQKRFIKGGADAKMTPALGTDFAAYALYHREAKLDADSMQASFKDDTKKSDAQNVARWILALTAADLDASQIKEDESGKDLILFEEGVVSEKKSSLTLEDWAWVLPIYQNYSDSRDVVNGYLDTVLKLAVDDKDAIVESLAEDNKLMAQVALALSPYVKTDKELEELVSDTDVKERLTKIARLVNGYHPEEESEAVLGLVDYLKAAQNADGGFIAGNDVQPQAEEVIPSDFETTVYALAASAALGTNGLGSEAQSKAAYYLVSLADEDLTGYKTLAKKLTKEDGEASISALALMGLEASLLTESANKTTNVLTFPVRTSKEEKESTAKTSSNSSGTASTGDATGAGLMGLMGLVAAGAAGVAYSRRKINE